MTIQKALEVFGYSNIDKLSAVNVKKTYLELASKKHPDKGGTSEEFVELKDAYTYLKNFVENTQSGSSETNSKSYSATSGSSSSTKFNYSSDYVNQLEYINSQLSTQNEKLKKTLKDYEGIFNKQIDIFNNLNDKLTKIANNFNTQTEKNKSQKDKATEELKNQYQPAFKDLIAPFQRRIDKEEYVWRQNNINTEYEDKRKELENNFLNSMVEIYQNNFEDLASLLEN
jgi:DnaJ-class molecular chaperone